MWNRIIAVLMGIFTMVAVQRGLALQWYWAFLLGVLAYFLVRYIGYGIRERRINAEAEAAMRAMVQRRQNSN
jgi:hypothetical protein